MATKDKFIHCRLSDRDFERFHTNAEKLGLALSEYIRYLIRIPVEPYGHEGGCSVVVLDRTTMGRIHCELVRQGHHYNQAVHALNTSLLHEARRQQRRVLRRAAQQSQREARPRAREAGGHQRAACPHRALRRDRRLIPCRS